MKLGLSLEESVVLRSPPRGRSREGWGRGASGGLLYRWLELPPAACQGPWPAQQAQIYGRGEQQPEGGW